MPIIKSAKKRVKVAAKQSVQNARTKKNLRTAIKAFQAAVKSGKKIDEAQMKVQSTIDTAAKKNVISKNKASRLISRLNAQAKTANGGKKKKSPDKKAVTKKKPATKTVKAKKTATTKAKKAPAKKKTTKK